MDRAAYDLLSDDAKTALESTPAPPQTTVPDAALAPYFDLLLRHVVEDVVHAL